MWTNPIYYEYTCGTPGHTLYSVADPGGCAPPVCPATLASMMDVPPAKRQRVYNISILNSSCECPHHLFDPGSATDIMSSFITLHCQQLCSTCNSHIWCLSVLAVVSAVHLISLHSTRISNSRGWAWLVHVVTIDAC